jgi:hypothetical protein
MRNASTNWQLYTMRFLLLQSFAGMISALAIGSSQLNQDCVTHGCIAADLNQIVSAASEAKVELRARWSDYNAPSAAVVANVASEEDVAAVVCSMFMAVNQKSQMLTSCRSNTARRSVFPS